MEADVLDQMSAIAVKVILVISVKPGFVFLSVRTEERVSLIINVPVWTTMLEQDVK